LKPLLLLQLRPIDLASQNEYEAFLTYGGLKAQNVHRIRMDKEEMPSLDLNNYSGLIIGGGPSNVSDTETEKMDYEKCFETQLKELLDVVFERDFPTLGCCYGIGAINKHQGGIVSKEKYAEGVGAVEIELTMEGKQDDLLKGLPDRFMAYTGHKEACQTIASAATLLASTENCPFQMLRFRNNIYATQFHPELDDVGIQLRINIYKDHGYFSPDDANTLALNAKRHHVEFPNIILKNFIDKYKRI
jgi:GMP synthase (glutamine-hydrolysing)